MKNYKNHISFAILILVLSGLIFAFSQITKNNNLNASNNNNQQNIAESKPFEYVPSRNSIINSVSFENNYGGTNFDEVKFVYNLGNYYLIGETLSTDNYFQKSNSNSIFVLVTDKNGNVINVKTQSFNSSISIITAKIFNNSIYILVNSNGCNLIEFNMSTNSFNNIYSINLTPLDLIISSEPIIVLTNNNETTFYFTKSKTSQTINENIVNIKLGCDYANGTLLIYNTQNNIFVSILNKTSIETKLIILNCQLETFNITETNFILLINENNNFKVQIYNHNFELENTLQVQNGTNFVLQQFNNVNYLTFVNNNFLNILTFCNHGDLLNLTKIQNNVESFSQQSINNNLIFLTKNSNNTITISSYNYLGELKNNTTITVSNKFEIVAMEVNYNLNFVVIGNFENANSLITSSFGNQDVFMFEVKI